MAEELLPRGPNFCQSEASKALDRSVAMHARQTEVPPELVDIIIGLLHDDRATLAASALVCRSWLPASRYHLFSEFAVSWKNISDASELVSSPTCTFASTVKHLKLHSIYVDSAYELPRIVHAFSNITRLSLSRCRLSTPQSALILPLRNLECLRLQDVSVEQNGASLFSLINHCPQLQNLACSDITFSPPARPWRSHFSLYPRLDTLQVHACNRIFQLGWVMACPMSMISRLTAVDLLYASRNLKEHANVAKLLGAAGSTLQILRLSTSYSNVLQLAPTFSLLVQLRSFSFDNSQWDDAPDGGIRFILRALNHSTSTHLQELSITLPSVRHSRLDRDAWSELGSLVETPQFLPALCTLAFRFRETHTKVRSQVAKAREQWIQERFPLCSAREILHVETLAWSRRGD